MKAAVQPRAAQDEGQVAFGHAGIGIGQRLPRTTIPRFHCAGAVLAVGNGALEACIIQRMIFNMGRDALVLGIERRPLAHRPAPKDPVVLQAEVPVQAGTVTACF